MKLQAPGSAMGFHPGNAEGDLSTETVTQTKTVP